MEIDLGFSDKLFYNDEGETTSIIDDMVEDDVKNKDTIYIGVDEVGRGALSGPIVASAYVLLPEDKAWLYANLNEGLVVRDSKRMSAQQRARTFNVLGSQAHLRTTSYVEHGDIDAIGIAQANKKAMKIALQSAVEALDKKGCDRRMIKIIIDYHKITGLDEFDVLTIPRAESQSYAVALASIWAKVTRDTYMENLGNTYPDYGWAYNKGYGTAQHLAAIRSKGSTQHHRQSFLTKVVEK